MQYNVDWCSGLSSVIRDTPDQLPLVLQIMKDQFQITQHCLVTEYDATRESVRSYLLRQKRLLDLLQNYDVPDHRLKPITRVLLTPRLYETQDLHKLLFSRDHLLCLRFPISSYEDWMDLELNHLLYKRKLRLCFSSLELAVILYPKEVIEKLMRIQGAVFQVNYRALADPKICRVVQQLIKQNSHVLLGTGIDSLDKIWYYEFDYYMEAACNQLSDDTFMTLMRNNRQFWRKI